jgi:hypothetical protein
MRDNFEAAASLCERLAVHRQAIDPNDAAVAVLNKAADLLQQETPARKHGWVAHKADCHCETCYLINDY